MQLEWNLSRSLFLGDVVDLNVLMCTELNLEHVNLFL